MKQYEVTFIVDPVLADDEVKTIAKKYVDFISAHQGEIVHIDEMGLRQLAYPIKKRNSGVYYCIEFRSQNGVAIDPLELDLRRNEQILRFLTVSLDMYGVKYNADKRAGLIGKRKPAKSTEAAPAAPAAVTPAKETKPAPKPEVVAAPAPEVEVHAPVVETPTHEVEAPAPVTEVPASVEVIEMAAPIVKAPVEIKADDLKKIEGIGPKIEELLHDAGIRTFAQLAETSADRVREILEAAGSHFASHDPGTWAQQSQLAADGRWDELTTLQDELKGGRPADDVA